jgi:pimeloyl-ACP methyl ester carboxylesterase
VSAAKWVDMGLRRRIALQLAALAAIAAVAAVSPAAPTASAAPAAPPVRVVDPAAPDRECGAGSWVAGTVDICRGELVHRDYVYDALGAAQHQRPPATVCHAGAPTDRHSLVEDHGYEWLPPAGQVRTDPGNLGDLVSLRVSRAGKRLHVQAELNTLFEPDSTKVVLVVDTDGQVPGLPRPLPAVRGVQGIDWDEALVLADGEPGVVVDVENNTLTGSMPLPGGSTWRLQAVTALADGTVTNVAFRGHDECGFWWDNRQAFALAAGDVSTFHHRVAVADLRPNVTRMAPTPRGEVLQRVYISDHPLGEGVSAEGVPGPAHGGDDPVTREGSQAFNLLGIHQPYGFYLPTTPAPHGLQVLMHGLTENHSARFYLGGATAGRITEHFGEARNRVLAAPAGRGWRGWYSSYSERDVLDVLDDVAATYDTRDDEVIASGYSMGGYGAMRLAALHPDRFAGVVNWVGFTGDFLAGTPAEGRTPVGALGSALDLLGNMRHVPGVHLYAGADELVLSTGALELERRLAAQELPSVFYMHPAAEHLTFAVLDDWRKESADSAGWVRPERVDHVTFRTDRRFFFPELDIVPNRSYWVSGIEPAGPGYADVEARTWGCGLVTPTTSLTTGAGPFPVPWVSQTVAHTGETTEPARNHVELTLANVASVQIDVGSETGACLTADEVTYRVTTDRPVTITLSDGRHLDLPPGDHEGMIRQADAPVGEG